MNIKKLVSGILVVLMLFSLVPANIFAANKYSDTKGHWAEAAIDKWSEYGILLGYPEGNFLPGNGITRAEMAAIINRVMDYTERAGNGTFSDVSVATDWFADDILKLNAAGIILGTNGRANPKEKITRQEAVTMIARAFDIYDENARTSFTDEASIDNWALPYVRGMRANGYINGYQDGSFHPKEVLTRAEVVTILDNIIREFYNNSSTYGTSSRTTTVVGNVVISSRDVSLINYDILGDLYITQGVDRGEVDISGTKVSGTMYVWGGGSNTVSVRNSDITNAVLNSANTRLLSSASTFRNITVINGTFEANETSRITTLNMQNGTSNLLYRTEADYIITTGGSLNIDNYANVKNLTATNTQINVKSTANVDKLTINQGSRTTLNVDGIVKELSSSENIKVTGSGTIEKSNMADSDAITLKSVEADGAASPASLTTKITLTFDKDIENLTASDITLTPSDSTFIVTKGTLVKVPNTTGKYELPISSITKTGQVKVTVNKSGTTVNDAEKTVTIYFANTVLVTVNGIDADGSASPVMTTKITFKFNQDIANLTAADFTITNASTDIATGVQKGVLTKIDGKTGEYELALTNIQVSGLITVTIAKSGYTFSQTTKNLNVYFATTTLVSFSTLAANGTSTETTKSVTLRFSHTFDNETNLYNSITINDYEGTGARKGAITKVSTGSSGSATSSEYELTLTNITKSGNITVTVNNLTNYTITSPSTKAVSLRYVGNTAVQFLSIDANGTANVMTTDTLKLVFDKNITGFTTGNYITLSRGTVGSITNPSTGVYEVKVNGITSAGSITVTISAISGYTITPTSRSVDVYYNPGAISANLMNVEANGGNTSTSTKLTLTFDKDITGLSNGDITINKGNATFTAGTVSRIRTGVYEIPLTGVTAGGNISVSVSKDGYNFSTSSITGVQVYHSSGSGGNVSNVVTFNSVSAINDSNGTTTTLRLVFSNNLSGLTAGNITLTGEGVTKGTLTGSGSEYALSVTVAPGAEKRSVKVDVSLPTGFVWSGGGSRNVDVYYSSSVIDVVWTRLRTSAIAENTTTTELIVTFDRNVTLSKDDFRIAIDTNNTGAKIASISPSSGSASEYVVTLTGVTKEGDITLAVSNSKYNFLPNAWTPIHIQYGDIKNFTFASATVNSTTDTTTALVLTFTGEMNLSADDLSKYITVSDVGGTGITVARLEGGTGKVYTLQVSGVTKPGRVTVNIAPIPGYNNTHPSLSVDVLRKVIFQAVEQNGNTNTPTAVLTLKFDDNIEDLSINDITISGTAKLNKTSTWSNPSKGMYQFTVDVKEAGKINVKIENKSGYIITPAEFSNIDVYCGVTLKSVVGDSTSGSKTTTKLTLTFDKDIPGLSATNITLSGMTNDTLPTKGAWTPKGNGVYELALTGVNTAGNITVTIGAITGYIITPTSMSGVAIYY